MICGSKSLPRIIEKGAVTFTSDFFCSFSRPVSVLLSNQGRRGPRAQNRNSIQRIPKDRRYLLLPAQVVTDLDGRGGERAPNIAQNREVQRLSDPELMRIVREGVPGTGMPAFHSLASSEVKAVVAYLRSLQGINKSPPCPAIRCAERQCSTAMLGVRLPHGRGQAVDLLLPICPAMGAPIRSRRFEA